jgi:flavin-binding protein dodecin
MSIAKVIEVISEGDCVDDAVKAAVKEASKTVRGIKQVYVEGIQAIVEDDKVVKYRINAKVTFVVD